jgi:hypothetical protein
MDGVFKFLRWHIGAPAKEDGVAPSHPLGSMKMDEEIISALSECVRNGNAATQMSFVPMDLVQKTIERLEFLRLHAGAITEGETFGDIAKRTQRGTGEEPYKAGLD